jgi:hypothetical protein
MKSVIFVNTTHTIKTRTRSLEEASHENTFSPRHPVKEAEFTLRGGAAHTDEKLGGDQERAGFSLHRF